MYQVNFFLPQVVGTLKPSIIGRFVRPAHPPKVKFRNNIQIYKDIVDFKTSTPSQSEIFLQ